MWVNKVINDFKLNLVIQIRILFEPLFKIKRFNKLKELVEKESNYNPNRRLLVELLNELDADLFSRYIPSTGCGTKIITLYPNIEEYSRNIKLLIKYVEYERPIPNGEEYSELFISLDRFLISRDEFYLDPEVAISDFKECCLKLCSLMEKSDKVSYGVYEHNLRLLTKMFVNLRMILIKLISVSYNKQY